MHIKFVLRIINLFSEEKNDKYKNLTSNFVMSDANSDEFRKFQF